MATETATATDVSTTGVTWKEGVVAGLAGSFAMGISVSVMMTPVLETAIPAMYGIEGPAGTVGWFVHMSHGAVIGVGFAALAAAEPDLADSVGTSVGAGVAYGVAVWLALAVIVMPIWLDAVGFPGAPPLPNVSVPSFVGHVVYGAVLGAVFPLLDL